MRVAGTGLLAVALLVGQGDLKSGVSTWVGAHQKEIVGELLELLAIPNVAADGSPVLVKPFVTARDEYEWVANEILERHDKDKLNWSDFAILVRTNFTARDVSEALERSQVPHVRVEEEKFFQRAEIKAAIAHLRILRNAQEANALHRFLQVPPKGIGEATLEKVSSLPKEVGLRLGDLLLPATHRDGDPFGALSNYPSVVVDIETTGLDIHLDEVVELAALKGDPAPVYGEFNTGSSKKIT